MAGTDMTTTWTGEAQAAVVVAMDHHSAECVGIHAARRATRFEALEPIHQGVRHSFGAFAKNGLRHCSIRRSGTITIAGPSPLSGSGVPSPSPAVTGMASTTTSLSPVATRT